MDLAAQLAGGERAVHQLVLLHCVSSYPAPDEQSNVRTVPHLAEAFGVVGGLSDHTPGTVAAVTAVALGVSVETISWGHTMNPRNVRYHRFGLKEDFN